MPVFFGNLPESDESNLEHVVNARFSTLTVQCRGYISVQLFIF